MLVYNAMSLVSTNLSGNAYLNYIYSGLVEIPAYIFSPFLMNWFEYCLEKLFFNLDTFRIGRKKTVITSHIFTGASLLPLVFIPLGKTICRQRF